MSEKIRMLKLAIKLLLLVFILSFAAVGFMLTWTAHIVKDYDQSLTQKAYTDVAIHQKANLVFYKVTCPYCEAGKQAVIKAADKSSISTFYIDVESQEGQVLVKKYQVEKAATIIQIRNGVAKKFIYAAKDKQGRIKTDSVKIKEAFAD